MRTLALLALAVALALATPALAGAGDPVIDELIQQAKIDTTITPADPSLPDEIKAWLGRWEGSFLIPNGTQAAALIVRRIEPAERGEYRAQIVTVWGPWSSVFGGSSRGRVRQLDAVVQGRLLRYQDETWLGRYTMRPDRRTLDGEGSRPRGPRLSGVLSLADASANSADPRGALEALRRSGILTEEEYRRALERLGR
jgi:hypothetical protein